MRRAGNDIERICTAKRENVNGIWNFQNRALNPQ